jgi:hypothetical protein
MLQAIRSAAQKVTRSIRTPGTNPESVSDVAMVEELKVGRLNPELQPGRFVIAGFAWRCVWDEIEGGQTTTGGTTYALNESYIRDFVKIFKDAIDPVRPMLENRVKSIDVVRVEPSLFSEMITNTSGIVHVSNGLHKFDLERR